MEVLEPLGHAWQNIPSSVAIEPAHTDIFSGPPATNQIASGAHYYRLLLAGIGLGDSARWSRDARAVVSARLHFRLGDRNTTIMHVVTLEPPNLVPPRVLDHALTPLVPFNGGAVGIEVDLFMLDAAADALDLLNALGAHSRALLVPQFSSRLAESEVIEAQLAELLQQTRTDAQLRLRLSFGERRFHRGYFATFGFASRFSADQLWVRDNRLLTGWSPADASPLTDAPYMLLRIESETERNDITAFGSIREPYERAIELLDKANYAATDKAREETMRFAEQQFAAALDAIRTAPELTEISGRNQLIEALMRGFDEARSGQALGVVPAHGKDAFSSAWDQRISDDHPLMEPRVVLSAPPDLSSSPPPRPGAALDIPDGADFDSAAPAPGPPGQRAEPPEPVATPLDDVLGRPVGAGDEAFAGARPQPTAATPTDEYVVVHRTPHMEIKRKQPLKPGGAFKVHVFADREAPRKGEQSVQIAARVKRTATKLDVETYIAGTGHFVFGRKRVRTLSIPLKEPEGNKRAAEGVTFEVAVKRHVADASEPRLWAYFTHDGRPCGQVSIAVAIEGVQRSANADTERRGGAEAADDQPPPPDRDKDDAPARIGAGGPPDDTLAPPVGADRPDPPSVLRVETAPPPDLTIEITDPSNNRQALECCLRSPHRGVNLGPIPWTLPQETGAFVTGLMKDFVQPGALPKQRLLSLLAAGEELWNTVPQPVRDAIWKLIDGGKLETILVVSAEPNIPWELMTPMRVKGARYEILKPLGVMFSMGRWTPDNHLAPPHRVTAAKGLVIAPDYPGAKPKPLKHAEREARDVSEMFSGLILRPADFTGVESTLFTPGYDLVHFVCHGANSTTPGTQSIYLEDREFSSRHVRGMKKSRLELKERPFVFLNACEVGRPLPALDGIGGFARAFIELGASAVVAPLWSVEDDVANQVASEFYAAVKASPAQTLGAAFKAIRAKSYVDDGGPDSYAAYCLYGDPTAILQESNR